MTLERLFAAIIPENIAKDILQYSYAKNLVGACIISVFASPIYALIYYLLNDIETYYTIFYVEIFCLLSLFILKYFHSLLFANVVFISAITVLFFWLTYHLGGIFSATAYWLILPPLVAAFVGGAASAFLTCAISIIAITFIFFLETNNFKFPTSPITNPLLLQYTAICGLNIVIVMLIYFYEMGKKNSLEKLRYLAYNDELTGLPNQIAYEEILDKAIEKSKKNHTQFSIIFIDIDQFHKINMIFGRQVGDELLKEIVRRIKLYIRYTDTMTRVGGDAFKIVIETTQTIDEINELSDILFMIIKLPYHIHNEDIYITASIGIVVYPTVGIEENLLDRYVETALSKAKYLGGNNLQHFTKNLAEEGALQTEIEYHLSDAINNNELTLFFQPRFSTKNSTIITGLEALLRWNNSKLGDVPPSIFIPIAERMGIISQFGEWILREACQQYKTWLEMNLVNDSIQLAINISVHQLYNENFLNYVGEIITQTSVPPGNIELELTETAVITDLPRAISMLKKLSNLGIHIVIDDFGSGYTSLGYLDKLPISALKIDKAFLMDFDKESNNSFLIEFMIGLAHKMNLTVVVEGVETTEQLNYLKKINCDHVQGYFLSKPLSVADTLNLLKATK